MFSRIVEQLVPKTLAEGRGFARVKLALIRNSFPAGSSKAASPCSCSFSLLVRLWFHVAFVLFLFFLISLSFGATGGLRFGIVVFSSHFYLYS